MLIISSVCKYNVWAISVFQRFHSNFKNQVFFSTSYSFYSNKNANSKNVQFILEKFNIEMSNIKQHNKIFKESSWIIEKKIILLKELGMSRVSTDLIVNFTKAINLSVPMFKAHTMIHPETNLIKNLFSTLQNCNIDYKSLYKGLPENMLMKFYYVECLNFYLKNILNLNNDQLNHLRYIKYRPLIYNSFSLLERLLTFLKNDLHFDSTLIINNKWLLSQHPGRIEVIANLLLNDLQIPVPLILRYPHLLNNDLEDLQNKIKLFKEYEITPEMIEKSYQNQKIINFTSGVFKRRVNNLLKCPYTVNYHKHPRFLKLVSSYDVSITRVRFLEEKNFKYASIQSLTTFHNPYEKLTRISKTTTDNLLSFVKVNFKQDYQKLLKKLMEHEYYRYVPLVQMYETLRYLKTRFTKRIIYKHIYAILYNKRDIECAYKALQHDAQYHRLRPNQRLAMCIYKIEEKNNFTGEAVLINDKYAINDARKH